MIWTEVVDEFSTDALSHCHPNHRKRVAASICVRGALTVVHIYKGESARLVVKSSTKYTIRSVQKKVFKQKSTLFEAPWGAASPCR
jgi:hypothetical protein